ncbi:unnamed protein product, partial [Ectocarpus fasciculatus]
GGGKGFVAAGEGEAVQGDEGHPRTTARARGRGAAVGVPGQSQGEDEADESDGLGAQHVPGTGERVQVRDGANHPRAARRQAQALRAQAPGADVEGDAGRAADDEQQPSGDAGASTRLRRETLHRGGLRRKLITLC